jgi:hypothetical protein
MSGTAATNQPPPRRPIRLTRGPAMRANKSRWPPDFSK